MSLILSVSEHNIMETESLCAIRCKGWIKGSAQLDPFLLTGSSGHDDLSLISSLSLPGRQAVKEDEFKHKLRCIILTVEKSSAALT
jgi:hypothetical protein